LEGKTAIQIIQCSIHSLGDEEARTLHKFVDEVKLGGVTDTVNGRTLVHSDLRNSGTGATENSGDSVIKNLSGAE